MSCEQEHFISCETLNKLNCPGPFSAHEDHLICHRCPDCRTPVNPWLPCEHCNIILAVEQKWPPVICLCHGEARLLAGVIPVAIADTGSYVRTVEHMQAWAHGNETHGDEDKELWAGNS